MTDDPDTATGPQGNMLPAGLAAAEAELRLRTSLDLAEITRLVLITARRLGIRIAHESEPVTRATFPAGEVIAFAADSPYTRCVRGGEPVVFDRPDRQTLEQERPAGRKMMSRYASFLALPTVSGDRATGLLTFARTAGPAFSDDDVRVAARLAAGTGAGIANPLTLLRERSLADTLQHSLLATEPAVPPGIEVAARCLPAEGQIVGGDWYHILALPGGRSGVIVGDVMGHGPEAAAVMAQLRAAAHALAQLDLEPAGLLGHLDWTTATLHRPVLATCVYAVIDPVGQSLGLGSAVYGQARIKLPPGPIIALYIDGRVETRTRSFDQGILALRAALSRWHGQPETRLGG